MTGSGRGDLLPPPSFLSPTAPAGSPEEATTTTTTTPAWKAKARAAARAARTDQSRIQVSAVRADQSWIRRRSPSPPAAAAEEGREVEATKEEAKMEERAPEDTKEEAKKEDRAPEANGAASFASSSSSSSSSSFSRDAPEDEIAAAANLAKAAEEAAREAAAEAYLLHLLSGVAKEEAEAEESRINLPNPDREVRLRHPLPPPAREMSPEPPSREDAAAAILARHSGGGCGSGEGGGMGGAPYARMLPPAAGLRDLLLSIRSPLPVPPSLRGAPPSGPSAVRRNAAGTPPSTRRSRALDGMASLLLGGDVVDESECNSDADSGDNPFADIDDSDSGSDSDPFDDLDDDDDDLCVPTGKDDVPVGGSEGVLSPADPSAGPDGNDPSGDTPVAQLGEAPLTQRDAKSEDAGSGEDSRRLLALRLVRTEGVLDALSLASLPLPLDHHSPGVSGTARGIDDRRPVRAAVYLLEALAGVGGNRRRMARNAAVAAALEAVLRGSVKVTQAKGRDGAPNAEGERVEVGEVDAGAARSAARTAMLLAEWGGGDGRVALAAAPGLARVLASLVRMGRSEGNDDDDCYDDGFGDGSEWATELDSSLPAYFARWGDPMELRRRAAEAAEAAALTDGPDERDWVRDDESIAGDEAAADDSGNDDPGQSENADEEAGSDSPHLKEYPVPYLSSSTLTELREGAPSAYPSSSWECAEERRILRETRSFACQALLHLSRYCPASPYLASEEDSVVDQLIQAARRAGGRQERGVLGRGEGRGKTWPADPLRPHISEVLFQLTRFPPSHALLVRRDGFVAALVECGKSSPATGTNGTSPDGPEEQLAAERDGRSRLWAARALQNLTTERTCRPVLAVRQDVSAVLSTMALRNRHPPEQAAALQALANLGTDRDSALPLLAAPDPVPALVKVAHKKDSSEDACRLACGTLANLALWMQGMAATGTVPQGLPCDPLPTQVRYGWRRWVEEEEEEEEKEGKEEEGKDENQSDIEEKEEEEKEVEEKEVEEKEVEEGKEIEEETETKEEKEIEEGERSLAGAARDRAVRCAPRNEGTGVSRVRNVPKRATTLRRSKF